ncbi:unnamed protein product [Dovyalis caffra]|uniref:Uncharacterized protein n=1 Tax=Dovyalis caffra TaxID=77055 RepID=A0AAV1SDN9_9ROSI|nr:unnamed protein product [Dovyalis caffra]
MEAEDKDDWCALYNLKVPGDAVMLIMSRNFRKMIVVEIGKGSELVQMKLEIKMKSCEFAERIRALGLVRDMINRAASDSATDQFHWYFMLEAGRRLELKSIIRNKSRIIVVLTSSRNKHALKQVLGASNVMNMIKRLQQRKRLHRKSFGNDITDLFRNADTPTRNKFTHLAESVKDSEGTAHIFSLMHISGEQLAEYSHAVLGFPLPYDDDVEE